MRLSHSPRNYLFLGITFVIAFLISSSDQQLSAARWPPTPLIPKKAPLLTQQAKLLIKPECKAVVVIDAGHGGKDMGAYSKKNPKYQEKFLTLSLANMVKNYLVQMGFAVIMTRSNDVFISTENRALFANKRESDLFVSLHFNSAPNKEAEGIEIFYYRTKADPIRSKSSEKLAQNVLKGIIGNTQSKSRGVKHGDLSVIRNTAMPAILVEGGFLTHSEEVLRIKSAEYLKKLAWGVAQGIEEYIAKEKKR